MWAVTGGTGLVGRFVVEDLLARGQDVVVLGRTRPPAAFFTKPVAFRPFDLESPAPDVSGCEALLHCAFDHVPGKYRGGEGDDPAGFRRRNVEGSIRLFEAARLAGARCGVFLSSRAAYGDYPAGTRLCEALPPRPGTLYGTAKLEVERAIATLATLDFRAISLRATGIYGPSASTAQHKWSVLFADHLAGKVAASRIGTEVHGADLAEAVWCLADAGAQGVYNVSDLVLDRHTLMAEVNRLTGCTTPLPRAMNERDVNAMVCDRLRAYGWVPRGMDGLRAALPEMLTQL